MLTLKISNHPIKQTNQKLKESKSQKSSSAYKGNFFLFLPIYPVRWRGSTEEKQPPLPRKVPSGITSNRELSPSSSHFVLLTRLHVRRLTIYPFLATFPHPFRVIEKQTKSVLICASLCEQQQPQQD